MKLDLVNVVAIAAGLATIAFVWKQMRPAAASNQVTYGASTLNSSAPLNSGGGYYSTSELRGLFL